MPHSNSYNVRHTDFINTAEEFIISPYTTNGPATPTTLALNSSAVSADTSLVLYGKGHPEYGNGMANNLVHMLENFSGSAEPTYSINGQLWFDTNLNTLRVRSGGQWVSMLQSDGTALLAADLDMGGFKVINMADPTGIQDSVTLGFANGRYVRTDTNSTIAGSIFRSTPQNILTVTSEEYITFSLLQSEALTLTGTDYDAAGLKIRNLDDPVLPQDAATANYVAAQIALGGGGTGGAVNIHELIDVFLQPTNALAPALVTNDILVYNTATSRWENKSFVGMLTSSLTTNPLELDPLHSETNEVDGSELGANYAASQSFVTKKIVSNTAPLITNVTLSGLNTLNFTTVDNTVTSLTVTQAPVAVVTNAVTHTNSPNTSSGDFIDNLYFNDPGYPSVALDTIIQSISERLYYQTQPNYNRTEIATVGQSSISPVDPYPMSYKVGYNNLSVFIDGMKLTASTRTQHGAEVTGVNINNSTPTGLANSSTVYSLELVLDGGAGQEINITGSSAQTWGNLISEINVQLVGGTAVILDGLYFVVTDTFGAAGNVIMTQPYSGSSGNDLLAATSADPTPASDTHLVGDDFEYEEIGTFGVEGTGINFISPLAGGEKIELQVINNMLL